MLLQRKTQGRIEWELNIVDSWLRIILMERLVDTDCVWELDWREGLHMVGEVVLDEWDGEGVAVEDLFPVNHHPSTKPSLRERK